MSRATAFAPGSIGNVGPGFDVLGLAVEGIGDRVTVELTDGESRVSDIRGRDADLVPRDPKKNVAVIAAEAWLRRTGNARGVIVQIEKGLALSGGMGGSAASSVAGAFAASLASGATASNESIIAAALEGESLVSGRHLDNIAPSVRGGLVLCRSVDPIDVIAIPVPARWSVVLLTPQVRIETKTARAILPQHWEREKWIQQMANTAALMHAFANEDADLVRRSLNDLYAEPVRAPLIPHFADVKRAALNAGAIGCSISGSGPTIFAITEDINERCAAKMQDAMQGEPCTIHIGRIARKGVRQV